MAAVESTLGQPLPPQLAGLLRECNGVRGRYGLDVVWSAERIAKDNADFRSAQDFTELYMPFEPLMFFGDNGGGDQFAFVRTPQRDEVFVWDHETDSHTWSPTAWTSTSNGPCMRPETGTGRPAPGIQHPSGLPLLVAQRATR